MFADAFRAALPPRVAVAFDNPQQPATGMYAEEVAHVAAAADARRREFAAGRRAARAALGSIGALPVAIPARFDRSPVWPGGIVGSIAHSESLCIAVVARAADVLGIGVDVESKAGLERDLWELVLTAAEKLEVSACKEPSLEAKRYFCAKEAYYKAQYPLTNVVLEFRDVELTRSGNDYWVRSAMLPPASVRISVAGGLVFAAATFTRVSRSVP